MCMQHYSKIFTARAVYLAIASSMLSADVDYSNHSLSHTALFYHVSMSLQAGQQGVCL